MSAVVHHRRAVELVERRKLCRSVERAVSRLIAILDNDPEAKPWLGASVALRPKYDDQCRWARVANDDRQQENGHGGDILDGGDDDQVDGAHSLGATESVDQQRWATVSTTAAAPS